MISAGARVRERLAAYLEGQARWRQQMAELQPTDGRHGRSAEGLLSLSAYVRGLPDGDERVRALGCLDSRDGVPFVAGERAGEVARRYAFDERPEAATDWLDRFLDAYTTDRVADLDRR